MHKNTSVYLDLVRFVAATVVLLFHAANTHFGGGWYKSYDVGYDAVMLFFVLSGLVIAYATQDKEHGLAVYAVNRLSRLWSVAVPALALTIIADVIGIALSASIYSDPEFDSNSHPAMRLIATLLFANQLWFLDIRPFSDWPFWSLGYEFWYYALFGACFYLKGLGRILAAAAVIAIAGPKVMLLAPIWGVGVVVHYWRPALSMTAGWALFVGPPIAYFFLKAFEIPIHIMWHTVGAYEQQVKDFLMFPQFVWFYFLGILVAAHFVGLLKVQDHLSSIQKLERPVRWLASCTLSIYLCHAPLLVLGAAILRPSPDSFLKNVAIIAFAFAGSLIFGRLIEPQRYHLRRALTHLLNVGKVKPLAERI